MATNLAGAKAWAFAAKCSEPQVGISNAMCINFVVNKDAGGVDGIGVGEFGVYIRENKDTITHCPANHEYL